MARSSRGDLFGRIVGFLVFLMGIGVILTVLWLAFELWRSPDLGIRATPTAADIGLSFARLIVRIALLFLGSISGSLIANKGVNLYFTALQAGPAAAIPVQPPAAAPRPPAPEETP